MTDQPPKSEEEWGRLGQVEGVEAVEMGSGQSTLNRIWALRSFLILVLTPLLLLPLPLVVSTPEGRCAYVVILMAVYWISESMPICVTALVPVILLPMLNLVTADDICKAYMNDTIMVFLGGLIMAVAIERWNIHKRIALRVLMLVGTEARWLMLGMMLSTWFLSMWISNTASTAMMVPIAEAILLQLRATRQEHEAPQRDDVAEETNVSIEMKSPTEQRNGTVARKEEENLNHEEAMAEAKKDPSFLRMCKALSLCIAYAANSGGVASLTGTGPNLVLKGQSDQIWKEYKVKGDNPVNFASWMAYGLPLSAVILLVVWLWLTIFFLRCKDACSCLATDDARKEQAKRVRNVIRNEYASLGPVTFAQGAVMGLFVLLVVLWVTRDLGGVGGWGNLFQKGMVEDSTPAIFIAVILFIFPSTIPNICCPHKGQATEYTPLLHWRVVHERMPWALFLLLGGGYALAKGCQDSGLSRWIGDQMTVFKDFNPWVMLLILCYICAAATEVTSNTAIATLVMPILANLAVATGVNPLFYMFPPAIAVSFAFCLPVATPPNAIVFSYGHVKVADMAIVGLVLNLVSVPILVMATATWGNAIFNFLEVPEAFRLNSTAQLTNITTAGM